MISVIDTNVLISGLLKVHTPPARVIDMILVERLVCAFDDRIFAEYAEVLRRPKFRAAIPPDEREHLLAFIQEKGFHVVATPLELKHAPPDIHDLPFVEAAIAGRVETIVTGNQKHFDFFQNNAWGIKILSPGDIISMLCAEGRTSVQEVDASDSPQGGPKP